MTRSKACRGRIGIASSLYKAPRQPFSKLRRALDDHGGSSGPFSIRPIKPCLVGAIAMLFVECTNKGVFADEPHENERQEPIAQHAPGRPGVDAGSVPGDFRACANRTRRS